MRGARMGYDPAFPNLDNHLGQFSSQGELDAWRQSACVWPCLAPFVLENPYGRTVGYLFKVK